jgi:hypothetical protein
MTSDTLQPEPLSDASLAGVLLRVLLAGAIVLLVLLLPAPAAATGGGDDGRHGARAASDPAGVADRSRSAPSGASEITRHDTC